MGLNIIANLLKIGTTKIDNYPGDVSGESIIATASGSADKGETAQVFAHGGVISNPAKDTIGLRIRKGVLDIIVGTMNYKIPLPELQGETMLFSTDQNGELKSEIYLDNEGNFIFNKGKDNAVKYSELETAFNQLKSDFDDLVTKYNSHIHVTTATVAATPTPGVISPTVATGTPSTADITPSKSEEIYIP